MSSNYIPNNEHFLKRSRNIRNELLNITDRYVLSDYHISLEQRSRLPASIEFSIKLVCVNNR